MGKQNTNTRSKGVLLKNVSIGVLGSTLKEFGTPNISERLLETGSFRLLETGGRRLMED